MSFRITRPKKYYLTDNHTFYERLINRVNLQDVISKGANTISLEKNTEIDVITDDSSANRDVYFEKDGKKWIVYNDLLEITSPISEGTSNKGKNIKKNISVIFSDKSKDKTSQKGWKSLSNTKKGLVIVGVLVLVTTIGYITIFKKK